jgi:nitrate/TMAO reductase-like tetraheme cytochrome c subunit
MHAHAIADPIFQTLDRIGQQRSDNQLNQFCVKCHTPFGSFLEETPPGFNPENLSGLGRSAIHCDVCHTIKTADFKRGEGLSEFHLDRVRRGPIEDPQANTFHESQFDPLYNFSNMCSACHDVLSPDLSRQLESTNTEWDNSPYLAMGVECQNCHMPVYSGQAAVGGPQRSSLHRHYFVGVDYPLVDFPGREATIERVKTLLESAVTVTVAAPQEVTANENFTVEIRINNDKTGHNIPSGTIFERQMWIELIVKDPAAEIVYFSTGLLDDNGDLRNHHSEAVAGGNIPADSALTLFNGTPYDKSGHETLFFWEADSVQNNTIAAFQTHLTSFTITAPPQPATLELSFRLRFRSFPPYLFRAIGKADLIPQLIIFDMETYRQGITVQ